MTNVAIVGVGNCSCSLIQLIDSSKKQNTLFKSPSGLTSTPPNEIRVVAAFDVDARKVNQPLTDAIFAEPNCTTKYYQPDVSDVVVSPGPVLDGVAEILADRVPVHADCAAASVETIEATLRASGADIVVIFLPVGSQEAAELYAEAALRAGCGLVNCTPAFLGRSKELQQKFADKNLPLLGDDMKSCIGSTVLHEALLKTLLSRGVTVDKTYQLNVGGNHDFLNMRDPKRAQAKRVTKSDALRKVLGEFAGIGVGPSDYVESLLDNKVGYIHIEGTGPLGMQYSVETRLTVEDSPNSASISLDGIMGAADYLRNPQYGDIQLCNELFKSPKLPA